MDRSVVDTDGGAITGSDWRVKAEWLHARSGYFVALAGVRESVKLLIEGRNAEPDADNPFEIPGEVTIEAWEGYPDDTDGIAVWGPDSPRALARIGLCGCGARGCGNAGR